MAHWKLEKTGVYTETGAIWSEIGDILDARILDGRPARLIQFRYQELVGRNWLTLGHSEPYRKLPTELTNAAIGVPSHDLRTLAADYMRRHDPAHAANVIATHMGHDAPRDEGHDEPAIDEPSAPALSRRPRVSDGRNSEAVDRENLGFAKSGLPDLESRCKRA